MSDVRGSDDRIVVVSITTYNDTGREDLTCAIYEGEHPFVRHASWVVYRQAWITTASNLRSLLATRSATEKGHTSDDLLRRITNGFADSPHVPPECYELLRSQGHVV